MDAPFTVDSGYVAGLIPPRRRDSHKGMNGVACLVGGSRVYHGAPFLAAMGAMRTGLDLVYLAVPSVISAPVRALSPDLIVFPLPDSRLTRGNVSKLKGWLPELDAVGVGPGLGYQSGRDIVNCIRELGMKARAVVVDADALRPEILSLAGEVKRMVITPHAGEFARVFGAKLPDDTEGRAAEVSRCARENRLTIIVKGPTDVVSDGERVALNTTHSPSMTVGGTGDVLTGITTGLLAKGMGPFEASSCAVHINGLAGVEATRQMGLHITASDVANCVANVMKQFDRLS